MKRLLDTESAPGSLESLLTDLVRAVRPIEPNGFRKHRIRAHLIGRHERRGRAAGLGMAASLLVAATASAAIMVTHWMHTRSVLPPAPHEVVKPEPAPLPPAVPIDNSAVPAPSAPAEVEQPRLMATPSLVRRRPLPTTRSKQKSDDSSAIVGAIHALRTDHDPDRAGKLLSGYIANQPNGPLVEDALALSIEAAVARHDPRASDYAGRYLAQFPDGRFAKLARKVLLANVKQ